MNIAEIAEMAGVSRAAVSRYFNQGYISDEKREAIRKVVEETGYRPSVQAQTLRTKKTKMIGVIVPKVASGTIGKIVEGVLSVLNEHGYQALLAVTQNDAKKELEYLTAFCDKQVDGVILAGTVFSAEHKRILKNLSVPVVIVGQQLAGYCCVFHDDYHASYAVSAEGKDEAGVYQRDSSGPGGRGGALPGLPGCCAGYGAWGAGATFCDSLFYACFRL